MISTLNTWNELWSLFILLAVCYWALKLIIYLLDRFAKRNIGNKNFIIILKKVILFYNPVAVLIIALGFISINYITHTIVLIILGVFGYSYITNYINGIFFQINPLFREEASVKIGDFRGEIEKVMPFGVTISTEEGEHYLNYSYVEKTGFTIQSDKDSVLRKTLYLKTDLTAEQVLDLLFDNPILSYNDAPTITQSEESEKLKLQYTLEHGSSTEELIVFLKDQNIQTSLTYNIL
ncbi:hypothetical protein [Aquimarina muelleri]|uniref:Mechanosensitive ion channel n=1 Tax=Aquimarina muelleri TaxID=279356 RepID=A0A918N5K9_9FLAO|nr:hypothetical protein [Aquimarina muelleri]MCX2763672.1 hypothetical protein [Aquimarina muelleri]GGX30230.1 hypothetical protein GCM10007384_34170 [Aquimarina muelleri]